MNIFVKISLYRVVFVSTFIFFIIFSYWGFDRTEPIVFHSYTLDNPANLSAGKQLKITWKLTRDTSKFCAVVVRPEIIDSKHRSFHLPKTVITYKEFRQHAYMFKGYSKIIKHIPPTISTGIAQYRLNLKYICNPLHMLFPIQKNISVIFYVSDDAHHPGIHTKFNHHEFIGDPVLQNTKEVRESSNATIVR